MRKTCKKLNKKLQDLGQTSKSGFTMIEFSLATALIAVLLVTIAIIISNIITIYQKGLTLKAVNSVGRGLIEELTTGINAAPSVDTTNLCNNHINKANDASISICKGDNANLYVFQDYIDWRDGARTNKVQYGGVFCTGNYSYIWNTYYAMNDNEKEDGYPHAIYLKYYPQSESAQQNPQAKVSLNVDKNGSPIPERLMRIEDPTYRVCSAVTTTSYTADLNHHIGRNNPIDITTLSNGRNNFIKTPETGFLKSFDLDLQLYEFTIFPISQDSVTLRTFMSGTFILATERGHINLTRSADYCDIDAIAADESASDILNIGSEFNYCAINKFNFAARTAGM